jgi:protease-4
MPNSIFHASIKSFFVTLFAMFGFGLGIFPLAVLLSSLSGLEEEIEVKYHYTPTIAANANDSRKVLDNSSPVILKIDIVGAIGSETLNTKTVTDQLTESREGKLKDNRVKAVLLHINSPGGTVTDADGIYAAIKSYKERHKVPVYAYVDGLCASGGMYVACAADRIFATDVSVVGSIGVMMMPFFNVTQMMEKIGVETKTIAAGKDKDELNPFRPWKEGEAASITQLTDSMYLHFLDIIATNRPRVNRNKLINEYGAKVFDAEQAMQIGLIDGVGASMGETLTLLARAIGAEDDNYQVVSMESKYWFSNLFSSQSPLLTGELKHEFKLNSGLMNQIFNGNYQ